MPNLFFWCYSRVKFSSVTGERQILGLEEKYRIWYCCILYFYAVMLECFRFNFEMFKILLYKVYMLKYRGVCHFVKITLKRWLFFTLILSILPPPIPKKKKKMSECSEETFLIWKFEAGKGISFAYFSTLNLLLQFSIINVIRIKRCLNCMFENMYKT